MHGYILPCGCSSPQLGGLERRYNFLQALKGRGWPVVALDLGDIPQKHGPVSLPNLQGLIKYRYSMQALKTMGYAAVSFGEYEASLPLVEAFAAWAIQDNVPRFVSANLVEPNFKEFVHPWYLASTPDSKVSVGVTAVVGPTVQAQITRDDPGVQFAATDKSLPGVLKEMAAKKVDLRVVLYHGSMHTPAPGFKEAEALALAKAYPEVDLILCLSESDLPAAAPTVVKHADGRQTMLVSLGHKSKYVGVAGIFPTGNDAMPWEVRYQLAEMTEDLGTPKDKEKGHKIVELMEQYTAELKKDHYLEKVQGMKHVLQVAVPGAEPTYVGSAKCGECHESAYNIWEKTPHAKAYQTLVGAKHPSLRQYDPECIVCHTVGFGYQSGFTTAEKTPKLLNVGCESCHGLGSEHVKHKNAKVWHELMNPWKCRPTRHRQRGTSVSLRVDLFCQKCHDIDNDVTWAHGGFSKKWPKIAHPTPPGE